MGEHDPALRLAVKKFWDTRTGQARKQGSQSGRDRGARAAVTGGKQMDGFVSLVHDLLVRAGVGDAEIFIRSKLELPGWFRAEKKWDLLVVRGGELHAAIEFKSQIGPSFGNNFNNRSEEAIGTATDLWAAYREGAFKPASRPWLGYLMLLEDCEASRRPVAVSEPHFSTFAEFKAASYRRRYELLVEKLLRDRLYDGACFLLSSSSDKATGAFEQPAAELTFDRFVRALIARMSATHLF